MVHPEVVAELHRGLKNAESLHAREDAVNGYRSAGLEYQQIIARALVTLLAAMIRPESADHDDAA
jgi:hypothetical protein